MAAGRVTAPAGVSRTPSPPSSWLLTEGLYRWRYSGSMTFAHTLVHKSAVERLRAPAGQSDPRPDIVIGS